MNDLYYALIIAFSTIIITNGFHLFYMTVFFSSPFAMRYAKVANESSVIIELIDVELLEIVCLRLVENRDNVYQC